MKLQSLPNINLSRLYVHFIGYYTLVMTFFILGIKAFFRISLVFSLHDDRTNRKFRIRKMRVDVCFRRRLGDSAQTKTRFARYTPPIHPFDPNGESSKA